MNNKFAINLKLARKARGYSQKVVAEMINVSNSSYSLYESGDREPNLATLEKIAHALYISIDELFGLYDFGDKFLIKESSLAYNAVPECTWQDYYNLPDGEHAELINGKLYYLGAPNRIHQKLSGELYYCILSYIKGKRGLCEVYSAPFAVKLSEEDNTIVQPDISVICNKDKLDYRGCNGGPDFVIEILSPSNKSYDCIEKLKLYSIYDIREYWIVDPDSKKVIVYQLDKNKVMPEVFSFDDNIKVNIFEDLYITIDNMLKS
jgi:Uma2 family endonuclease/DNA-binding XRE family transcriptional regulator